MSNENRRPLLAGNWKMNGLGTSAGELRAIIEGAARLDQSIELLICPPVTLLANFAQIARGTRVGLGAQDCHWEPSGAHTGDVSAEMIADAGGVAVIVGHSERRADHHETDAQIRRKTLAAQRAGIVAIVCVGETRPERDSGRTLAVIGSQLDGSLPEALDASKLVIAYEPVWAIGTGLTPTPQDVAEVHAFIRETLAKRDRAAAGAIRVLYGGSVKPDNAGVLLRVPNVDGALIGGASLEARDFLGIAAAVA